MLKAIKNPFSGKKKKDNDQVGPEEYILTNQEGAASPGADGDTMNLLEVKPYRYNRTLWSDVTEKGNLSNILSALLFFVGWLLMYVIPTTKGTEFSKYVLSFGLFGFSGGITNWLAVKMLFDKIPFLYGSGVIPAKFKEIRASVKSMFMRMFFDPQYLSQYLGQRAKDFLGDMNLDSQVANILNQPDVDELIIKKLNDQIELNDQTGQILNMAAGFMGGVPNMVYYIKPMLVTFAQEMGRKLVSEFDISKSLDVEKVREEMDKLLTQKLLLLTPEMVKTLMEDVIREHLGWLVVWGNVFGGLLGIISQAAGYGA
jgi:hypothetical protein